ncbi:sialin-like [Centruroides vittatus]|uniref:sialin-like n=1 Tax=Centruroides vittatus TaxID=120091 RepID=UPI00351035B1
MHCQRAALSVAILAMVNHSAIYIMHNETYSEDCPQPLQQNDTLNYKEGSYVWSQPTQGIILGSYFYGMVFAQFTGGAITYKFRPKVVYVICTFLSSLFVLLTPFTAEIGVPIISLSQIIIGFAHGLIFHSTFTLLAHWSPESEKTTLSSVSISGVQVGSIAGLIVTGYLCKQGDWSFTFYIFGTTGIVLSVFLLFVIYDRPQDHPRISEKELIYLNENIPNISSVEKKPKVPWKAILTSRIIWVSTFTKICWGFGYYSLLTKLPSYLKLVLHFPIQQNGVINALIYSVDAVTIFFCGFMADFVRRKFFSMTTTRKIFEAFGTLGPSFCILAITFLGCDSTKVIMCLTAAMGFFGFCVAGDIALVFDLAPDFAGILYGLTNGLCSITGIISPYVIGLILDKNQGDMVRWSYVFYMASSFYFLSGMIFLLGATAELQPWAIVKPPDKKEVKN